MKITINPTFDMETGALLSHDGQYEYFGPVASFNRAAVKSFQGAANTAGTTAGSLETEAEAEKGPARNWLMQHINAEHEFTPDQLNTQLTAIGAGAGGATSAFTGQGELEAARTNQGAGLTPALSQMARTRQQALARGSEGVAAQDVRGAVSEQQRAAQGLAQLGETSSAQALQAMGLQTKDIQGEVTAGQSGWFQNLTDFMKSAGGAAGGAGALKSAW